MKIFKTDIKEKKEFNVEGTRCVMLGYNEKTGLYLYGRYWLDGRCKDMLMGYEIVKPVKYVNPDGNIVYSYPSSSQFGTNGAYLPCTANQYWIDCCMNGVAADKTKVTGKCWNIEKYKYYSKLQTIYN